MIPACLGNTPASDQTVMTVGGFGNLGVVPGAFIADGSSSTSATTGALATLKTASIPAGALQTPSFQARGFRIRAWGIVANNANAKSAQLSVAGTAINVTGAITASVANLWNMDVVALIRTPGSAGALSVCSAGSQGPGTPTFVDLDTQIASVNLLNAMTIIVGAGAQVAGSDVTCDGWILEIF